MKNTSIIILSTFMLSNIAWGEPAVHLSNNSLSESVLEINAINAPPPTNTAPAKAYSNESQKNNSLSRGALAKQEEHTQGNVKSEVSSSPTKSTSSQQSSFFGAVLDKQSSNYK